MKSRHSITSAAWECPRWLVSNPQLLKKQSHFFCFLLSFHSYTYGMWRSPGSGSSGSCSCRSTPQPQPRQIRATSATYTKACGNARALTHRVRPGIKPTSSWMLVRSLTHRALCNISHYWKDYSRAILLCLCLDFL